jgi:DNA mismatch endonuclease, patch repair protein
VGVPNRRAKPKSPPASSSPVGYQPPEGSWSSSAANRKTMQANRSRDTRPELAVRSAVHARGLRYRVAVRPVHGVRRSADLVFTRARVAVFLDGCFWHGCPEHFHMPATNPGYWGPKIAANAARDAETDALLAAEGWTVLRFWEHTLAVEAATRIEGVVRDRLASLHRTAEPPAAGPTTLPGLRSSAPGTSR